MSSTPTPAETKYRTTFYLTEENKRMLDRVPKGKKTVLINQALSRLLKEMEKEQNRDKFIKMIADIEPVPSKYSSEEMVRALRENKPEKLFTDE